MIGYTGPWQGERAGGGGSDAPNHERKGGDKREGKEGGELEGVKEKRKVREKEENKRTFIINSLNRQAVRLRRRPRSVWASAALLTPTSCPKLLSPLLTFGCIHIHLFSAPRYPLSGLTPRAPCKTCVIIPSSPSLFYPSVLLIPAGATSEIWAACSILIPCLAPA